MRNPKFQVFSGKGGDHYFRLRAGNGQVVLASEGYESMAGALNGIRSVKVNAADDARYARKEAKDGQFFFTLRAGNNEPIGKSEMYKAKSSREHGIKVIKQIAARSPIEDLTF